MTAAELTIPSTADELEDLIGDPGKMQKVFANKAKFREFMGNYAKNVLNKDELIQQQVREQTQNVMAEFIRNNGGISSPFDLSNHGAPGTKTADYKRVSRGRGAAYNKATPGSKLDDEKLFEHSAEYFQAIWPKVKTLRNSQSLIAKLDKLSEIQNSFGSEVPADGGFLIPETMRSDILMWSLEHSIVRPLAQIIPMNSLRVPIPMIDSTSNVNSVFGGFTAYWTEESAQLTESQPAFGRVVLDAKKLTLFSLIPNELLADAVAFGSFFDNLAPQVLGFYEDYAFMQGDGNGQPLGFVNCPAVTTVTAEVGQDAGTIVYENLAKMYARMLPSSLRNAVWLCTIDGFTQLATMSLSVGTGGSAVWIGGPSADSRSASATPPVTIFGRPVIFTEKLPTLGTTGDICFVDLNYYLIGDRQMMQADSSEHYKFQNDQTAFRIIQRVDGRPWLQSAITQKNNSSFTLSPFVQLGTR